MGKQTLWVIGAALLLGWVVVSMYFLASGAPLNLSPEVSKALPFVAVGAISFFAFAQFYWHRRLAGNTNRLWIALGGAAVIFMIGYALLMFVFQPAR